MLALDAGRETQYKPVSRVRAQVQEDVVEEEDQDGGDDVLPG